MENYTSFMCTHGIRSTARGFERVLNIRVHVPFKYIMYVFSITWLFIYYTHTLLTLVRPLCQFDTFLL